MLIWAVLGSMEHTHTGCGSELLQLWEILKVIQNREGATYLSAAGFGHKQLKKSFCNQPKLSTVSDIYIRD